MTDIGHRKSAIRQVKENPMGEDPHPENVGIGEVTCRCGGLRLADLKSQGCDASMAMRCPTCGEWSDVLAERR